MRNEFTTDERGHVYAKFKDGGTLRSQSVECLLMLAILEEMKATRMLLEKLVNRSSIL